jgi:hypothetical protein
VKQQRAMAKDAHYSDLVEITNSSQKIQEYTYELQNHIKLESLTEDGWVEMECTEAGLKILETVKKEFKVNEITRSLVSDTTLTKGVRG